MFHFICRLCWKHIYLLQHIAFVRINNIILWTSYVNLNSYKNLTLLFQNHTFKAGCTSICPYTNRVFFWGSFPRVPKSIGGRGITDPSDKVCVPTSTNSVFAPNFPNSCKTHTCHVTVIAAVFWTYDPKCTIFRVRTSWHDHCMLLVTNCNSLLQSNQILNSC